MKKVLAFVAILMMTVFVTSGFAQVKSGSVHVSPTIGAYIFEGSEDVKNGMNLGLRAGYNFTKYIGVEAYGHYTHTGPIGQQEWSRGSDVNVYGYGVEGIFHLLPNGAFVPFVAAGVGGVHYSTTWRDTFENKRNKITADYGAGVKYFLTDNFALRGDVRHVVPFGDMHNNLLATVGVTLAFGGAKKAAPVAAPAPAPTPAPAPVPVAPVIVDTDKDGVPDESDKCPNTLAGVVVDENGCPMDSDKDGVADYLDKCPGTPAGVKVDKDGCPPPVVVKKEAAAAPEIIEKGRATIKVLFDTNKANIKKGTLEDVDNLVGVMKQLPDLNVAIEGHTDSVGNAAYNKKLSQKRAESVKKYMVDNGIGEDRIKAVGFGMEKPIADNKTAEGRAKNRRVEAAVDYEIKKKK